MANRNRNDRAKARAKNKDKAGSRSFSGLDYRSSSEYPETPVDGDSNSFVEESESSEPEDLDLEPTGLQVDKDPHLPPDDMSMRPNIAPTAHMLSNQGSMGYTHSKLGNGNAEFVNTPTAGANTHLAATTEPSRDTASPTNTAGRKRTGAKRPIASSTTQAREKRSKFTPNVYNLKPRLVVILPLTRVKGASTRTRTEPIQQPPAQEPSSELEESVTVTRPSAPPTDLPADTMGAGDRPAMHGPQSALRDQGATRGSGTASGSNIDGSPSWVFSETDHSHQYRDVQYPISDAVEEQFFTMNDTSRSRPVGTTANDPVAAPPFVDTPQPTETPSAMDESGGNMTGAGIQASVAKDPQSPVAAQIDALDPQFFADFRRMREDIDTVTSTVTGLILGQSGVQGPDRSALLQGCSSSPDILITIRGAQEYKLRMKTINRQAGKLKNSDQVLELSRNVLRHILAPNEEFLQVEIDQIGGPVLPSMQGGFLLINGDPDDESWEIMLEELEEMRQKEDKHVRIRLEALVHVSRKLDASD